MGTAIVSAEDRELCRIKFGTYSPHGLRKLAEDMPDLSPRRLKWLERVAGELDARGIEMLNDASDAVLDEIMPEPS